MSLHHNHNVKEPSNTRSGHLSFPVIATGGPSVRVCWRPGQLGGWKAAASLRWSGLYGRSPCPSNSFCTFVSDFSDPTHGKPPNSGHTPRDGHKLDSEKGPRRAPEHRPEVPAAESAAGNRAESTESRTPGRIARPNRERPRGALGLRRSGYTRAWRRLRPQSGRCET